MTEAYPAEPAVINDRQRLAERITRLKGVIGILVCKLNQEEFVGAYSQSDVERGLMAVVVDDGDSEYVRVMSREMGS